MPVNIRPRAGMNVPPEFLSAKLRGRRRRVYEGHRLRELASCQSLEELSRRLYPRQPVMGRLGLERQLRQDCLDELDCFTYLLSDGPARFYSALLRRFQVDNILVLLRLFAGGKHEVSPERYVLRLPERMQVPSGELLMSRDLDEFLAKLPKDLAAAAARARDLGGGEDTTAFVEMALERAYWAQALEALRHLPIADSTACAGPVLHELGAARLLAVLRAGRHYELRWDRLQPLLPPSAEDLAPRPALPTGDGQLRELHRDPSAARLTAMLRLVRPQEAQSLPDIEDRLWRETFRIANRLYYAMAQGPAILVSYFYVRRNELRELTRLAESIHYGRPFRGDA